MSMILKIKNIRVNKKSKERNVAVYHTVFTKGIHVAKRLIFEY